MLEKSKEKLARNIYEEHRGDMTPREIFLKYMADFGADVEAYTQGLASGKRDWLTYARWVGRWRKEDNEKQLVETTEKLSDKDIELTQQDNRRRTVLMLKNLLDEIEKGKGKKKVETYIKDLFRLYDIVNKNEQMIIRNKIAAHKEGRETLKFLLPYQRLTTDELLSLKQNVTDAFNRLKRIQNETN